MRALSQSWNHLGAAWPQETLHLQELQVRQVRPDLRETAHYGSTGELRKGTLLHQGDYYYINYINYLKCFQ